MTAYLVHPGGEIEDIEIGSDVVESLQIALGADTVKKLPLQRMIPNLTLENDDTKITVPDPALFCDEDGGPKGLTLNLFISYTLGYTVLGSVVVMPEVDAPW